MRVAPLGVRDRGAGLRLDEYRRRKPPGRRRRRRGAPPARRREPRPPSRAAGGTHRRPTPPGPCAAPSTALPESQRVVIHPPQTPLRGHDVRREDRPRARPRPRGRHQACGPSAPYATLARGRSRPTAGGGRSHVTTPAPCAEITARRPSRWAGAGPKDRARGGPPRRGARRDLRGGARGAARLTVIGLPSAMLDGWGDPCPAPGPPAADETTPRAAILAELRRAFWPQPNAAGRRGGGSAARRRRSSAAVVAMGGPCRLAPRAATGPPAGARPSRCRSGASPPWPAGGAVGGPRSPAGGAWVARGLSPVMGRSWLVAAVPARAKALAAGRRGALRVHRGANGGRRGASGRPGARAARLRGGARRPERRGLGGRPWAAGAAWPATRRSTRPVARRPELPHALVFPSGPVRGLARRAGARPRDAGRAAARRRP